MSGPTRIEWCDFSWNPNKRGHDQALLDGRLWREVPQSSLVAEGQP